MTVAVVQGWIVRSFLVCFCPQKTHSHHPRDLRLWESALCCSAAQSCCVWSPPPHFKSPGWPWFKRFSPLQTVPSTQHAAQDTTSPGKPGLGTSVPAWAWEPRPSPAAPGKTLQPPARLLLHRGARSLSDLQ